MMKAPVGLMWKVVPLSSSPVSASSLRANSSRSWRMRSIGTSSVWFDMTMLVMRTGEPFSCSILVDLASGRRYGIVPALRISVQAVHGRWASTIGAGMSCGVEFDA